MTSLSHTHSLAAGQSRPAADRTSATAITATAAPLRLGRVAIIAAFVGFMCFLADHDWLTSRFEDYAGGSDFMEQVTSEGSLVRRIGIFALGLAGIIALFRSSGYRLRIQNLLGILIVAAATWCAATWFWSIDPSLTARRLISMTCTALAALAIARLLTPRELAATALCCTVAFFGIGVLTELALGTFHPISVSYRFAGTLHPNNQGLNCALLVIAASFLAWTSNRHRAALIVLAAVGLIGVWLTKSRTPLAALAISGALFGFLAIPWRQKIAVALAAIFIAASYMLITGDNLFDRVAKAALLGRDDPEEAGELSGRVPLWEELTDSISRRPLQGYGYASFWIPNHIEDISQNQGWAISAGHSTYLDLSLSIGLIGVALAASVALCGFIQAYLRHVRAPALGFGFIAVLLLFAMIHGLLESAFANPGFVPLIALSGLAMLAFVNLHQYSNPAESLSASSPAAT